jgi:hypothetical protein
MSFGPFETCADAYEASGTLREAVNAADPGGSMTDRIRAARWDARTRYVTDALAAAGIELGAYDERIAVWLAGFEPETVQVVTGWIGRAHRGLLADAAEAVAPCLVPDVLEGYDTCEHGEAWPCPAALLAWRLGGIDPETEIERALRPADEQFARMRAEDRGVAR